MAHLVTALSTAIYTIDCTGLERLETPMIAALLVRNVLPRSWRHGWWSRHGRVAGAPATRAAGTWDSAV